MNTFPQEQITENLQKFTQSVQSLAKLAEDITNSAENIDENLKNKIESIRSISTELSQSTVNIDESLKSQFEKMTDAVNRLIKIIFKSFKEDIHKDVSEFKSSTESIINGLQQDILEISNLYNKFGETTESFSDKIKSLEIRIDQFEATVKVLADTLKNVATQKDVDNCISREIANQSKELRENLVSKNSLEKLEKRIGGEDGEGGINGKIDDIRNSLMEKIDKVSGNQTWREIILTVLAVSAILASFFGGLLPEVSNVKKELESVKSEISTLKNEQSDNQQQLLQKIEEIEKKLK